MDIIEGDLGLIGKGEHRESRVTDQEAKDFMMPPTQEDANPKEEVKAEEEEEEDMVSVQSNFRCLDSNIHF